MKVRRSWNDIENPEGWEPFEAGLDSPPASSSAADDFVSVSASHTVT